jgi:hypothetical protein
LVKLPVVQVHLGDPRFDDWEVVADYEELDTALAFRDRLRELGLDAELTTDHPLATSSRAGTSPCACPETSTATRPWRSTVSTSSPATRRSP